MANNVVIHITGKDDASKVIGGVETKAKGLGSALGDVSKIAGGFVVAQGITSLGGFLMDAANAAAEDEAAQLRLKKAIENTGASFAVYGPKVEGVVTAAQKLAFSDDDARASLSLLMAQTGDADEAMRRLALAEDVARGAGIPLEQASKLLGKVTEENVNVFKKMGITLEEGATEAEAFAALQGKFAGQAETYANSTAGQMEKAKIQMGEAKEQIGTALLPIIAKLADFVATDLIPAFMRFSDWIKVEVIPVIKDLSETYGPAIVATMKVAKDAIEDIIPYFQAIVQVGKDIIQFFKDVFSGNWGAALGDIKKLAEDILKSIVAFIKLGFIDEILGMLKGFVPWDAVKDKMGDFKDKITGAFTAVLDFLKEHWPEIAVILSGPFAPIVALATDGFGVRTALQDAMTATKNFVSDRVDDIVGFFTGLPGRIWGVVRGIFEAATGIGEAIKNGIIEGLKGLVEAIKDLLGPLGDLGGKILSGVGSLAGDLGVSGMAAGGIVTRPTLALLGEHGKEAVIPLGQGVGIGGGTYINEIHMHVMGSILSERDLERVMADALRHGKFRGQIAV